MKTTSLLERTSYGDRSGGDVYFCCSDASGRAQIAMAEQCHYVCPKCLNYCVLTQGHYVKHQCSQGHEWL